MFFLLTTKNWPWYLIYLIKQMLNSKCNGVKVLAQSRGRKKSPTWQWTASRKSLEFDYRRGSLHSTHRIHGAAIYGAPWTPSIYPSHVSIFLPAPWIRHGYRSWLKKDIQQLLVLMINHDKSILQCIKKDSSHWHNLGHRIPISCRTLRDTPPSRSWHVFELMVEFGCGVEVARNSTDVMICDDLCFLRMNYSKDIGK